MVATCEGERGVREGLNVGERVCLRVWACVRKEAATLMTKMCLLAQTNKPCDLSPPRPFLLLPLTVISTVNFLLCSLLFSVITFSPGAHGAVEG